MLKKLLLAAGLAFAALPAAALDLTAMTEAERDGFRAEVRAYLLDNPEVLMEAIAVLEDRQAQEQAQGDQQIVADNADALFASPGDWVGGNPDGDITIVEFMDYRCGFCKRAYPEVKELVESDGNIRLIVKEFPILGPQSELAARFAISTLLDQGDATYDVVHDALMTLRGEITPQALTRIAQEAGFDPAAALDKMNSIEVNEIIDTNRALARTMQITGTPSFVMAGEMVRGYVPLDQMRLIVEAARDERG
jgi:protein-disulfide isomerase